MVSLNRKLCLRRNQRFSDRRVQFHRDKSAGETGLIQDIQAAGLTSANHMLNIEELIVKMKTTIGFLIIATLLVSKFSAVPIPKGSERKNQIENYLQKYGYLRDRNNSRSLKAAVR